MARESARGRLLLDAEKCLLLLGLHYAQTRVPNPGRCNRIKSLANQLVQLIAVVGQVGCLTNHLYGAEYSAGLSLGS